ncbi:hypothetical protein MLD38_023737 [Melastoma candidum]|uniref:Uncharacterized protein n=1 Tax=Melastoma candidum TaxID=119954 RepID=A0ACB9NQ17_9MYRT|nr:hypothetical protein MLD38_023737 [Melastoma candidum]
MIRQSKAFSSSEGELKRRKEGWCEHHQQEQQLPAGLLAVLRPATQPQPLNDSIWSSSDYLSKHSDRLNTSPSPIDHKPWNPSPSLIRPPNDCNTSTTHHNNNNSSSFNVGFFKNDFSIPAFKSDFNGFNFGLKDGFNGIDDAWKYRGIANGNGSSLGAQKNLGFNDDGVYSKAVNFQGFNGGKLNLKGKNEEIYGKAAGKKASNKKNGESDDRDGKVAGDKRFKTLPPSESLPKNEAVGGYIFVCNNDTMQENLKGQLFGTVSIIDCGFLRSVRF